MLGEAELVDGRPQKPISSVRVLDVNLTGVMYSMFSRPAHGRT
jgi:hypothetical protein